MVCDHIDENFNYFKDKSYQSELEKFTQIYKSI